VRPRARHRLAQLVELEPARRGDHGAASHLIDNEAQVQEEWLEGVRVVGITSGASAPEELVQRLVGFFRDRGTTDVEEFQVVQEDVRFMLPKTIRQALAAQSA
jgi:4-hydroxy-3-methylbut-2-en-1-yl diphosphate reductase